MIGNGWCIQKNWKVFCFCFKLFDLKSSYSKLANQGCQVWKNLSVKLKNHETSNEHVTVMNTRVEVEVRLVEKKKLLLSFCKKK